MNGRMLLIIMAILIFSTATQVHAETIPPNIWKLTSDHYNIIGEPQLFASIVGDPEYESGEKANIFIQLKNEGQVYGFEIVEEPDPANEDEIANAKTEFNLEYDVTTAVSIHSILKSNNEHIKVLSGQQPGGGLRSGETSQPIEFDIEIYENTPSGVYELILDLTYQYQYDVQVEGNKSQPDINYWYETKNQTLPIQIIVKQKADFEIVKVSADFRPDDRDVFYITYKNVGSETAEYVVASIIPEAPFSTTDNQAFIGTLKPGESYETQYNIKVESDALSKIYAIDTELEYKNEHGDAKRSDVMRVPIKVGESIPLSERIGYILIFSLIIGAVIFYIIRKRAS
ncbi:MAG: hypothetical protein E4G94_06615 [ANME-2 cluster archaeon]|nr:MAG: hypothetical protein E4G94_06615 [ANME-2 cluster archaeon]